MFQLWSLVILQAFPTPCPKNKHTSTEWVLGPENTEIQPLELSYTFESNALDLVTNSFFTAIKVNLLNLNKRVWWKKSIKNKTYEMNMEVCF